MGESMTHDMNQGAARGGAANIQAVLKRPVSAELNWTAQLLVRSFADDANIKQQSRQAGTGGLASPFE
jgi:hypothetical protein